MAEPKIFSGAKAILKINQKLLVFAQDCSYSINTDVSEIETIDESVAEELAPSRIRVEVTCTKFRIPGETAQALKAQPGVLNNLIGQYSTIEICDRSVISNGTILYVPRAKMVSCTGGAGSRRLSTETWTFRGLGWWNETEPTG